MVGGFLGMNNDKMRRHRIYSSATTNIEREIAKFENIDWLEAILYSERESRTEIPSISMNQHNMEHI